jgi:hypothetical protein
MSTQEVYTERQWTKEETDLLPFSYKPNKILIADSDPDTIIYNATWYNDPVLALDPTGPWALIKQGEENEQITLVHWEQAHPGITHVNVDNWHTLEGTFNNSFVRWSYSRQYWVYGNNRKVTFPEKPSEEEEVSQVLDESISALERTRSKLTPLTPTTSLPGSFDTPEPSTSLSQPPLVSAKGKTPVTQTEPQAQQPTPPVSRVAPAMANPAPAPKALGTPPEPFDGAASKAETFLSALQNYYYLNEALYNTQSRRIAAALSHFKVGTAAGEWARDKQNAALTANPINYGTWDVFIDDFKKHFIPVQTEQQAMNAIWTIKMGNRPFHEWFQEWSTYAARCGANDTTKMFAFRQALPQGLNDKLVGVSPAPDTLDALIDHARRFDQQWQMWRRPMQGTNSSRQPQGPRVRSNNTDDPSINAADANVQTFKPKRLTKEEKDKRNKNNECYYCGKPGHFARECRQRPNGNRGGRPRFNPARTQVTDTGEEAPPEHPTEEDAAVVASLYHDPKYHFDVLQSPADPTDF